MKPSDRRSGYTTIFFIMRCSPRQVTVAKERYQLGSFAMFALRGASNEEYAMSRTYVRPTRVMFLFLLKAPSALGTFAVSDKD
jgi:hypothetical protein